MRRIVLPLIALLVAAGVVFVVRDRRPVERGADPHERETKAAEQPALAEPAEVAAAARAVELPAPERTETSAPTPVEPSEDHASEEVAGAEEGIVVDGVVRLVDQHDIERADANGSFVATYWTGSSGIGADSIPVHDGRFRLRVPNGSDLGIQRLELDGRFAVPDADRLKIEPNGELIVRATSSRDVRLHVVDQVSRVELREVTVVASDDWLLEHSSHPGDFTREETLADKAVSPMDLQAHSDGHYVRWNPKLFALAPGYAWGGVEVDFRVGGEATIELLRGGGLQVTLAGEVPEVLASRSRRRGFGGDGHPAVLRVRQAVEQGKDKFEELVKETMERLGELTDDEVKKQMPGGRRLTEAEVRAGLAKMQASVERGTMLAEVAPDPGGTTTVAGLAPGRVVVALERGEHFDKPQVLGETEVEVVAGGVTHVTLTIAPPLTVQRVPLAGTVHFSPAWASTYLNLRFEPVAVPGGTAVDGFKLDFNDLKPTAGQPGEYRFDAGQVRPGRYLVKDYSHEFQQIVDTGPDGTDRAAIVIGDPADVTLRVIDADTGRPAGPECKVNWNGKRPEGSTGGSLDDATWDESAELFRLRAPAGEIELSLDFRLEGTFELLDPNVVAVQPGPNEITLHVRRATVVVLALKADGKQLDWEALDESIWRIRLVLVDDPDVAAHCTTAGDTGLMFQVPRPGRYRCEFPPLSGFEAVAPFEVSALRGERVNQEVVLQRKK